MHAVWCTCGSHRIIQGDFLLPLCEFQRLNSGCHFTRLLLVLFFTPRSILSAWLIPGYLFASTSKVLRAKV